MALIALSHTADGLPAVSFRHLLFALGTHADGTPAILTTYPPKPLMTLNAKDLHVDRHATFRATLTVEGLLAYAQELEDHYADVDALGRKTIPDRSSPWGRSDNATEYEDGIISVSTPSHGGFLLSEEKNQLVNPLWRADGGAYEEDACWAIVAKTFPHLFTAYERKLVRNTLVQTYPDEWEKITGEIIPEGECHSRNRAAHLAAHSNDWLAHAAVTAKHHPGMVQVWARKGGKGTSKEFLVPEEEYTCSGLDFVVDLARHQSFRDAEDARATLILANVV